MDESLAVRGPHLSLRVPRPADAPALFALASDPEVTRFFSWGPYRAVDEAERWLETLPARRESGVALELAVVDGDDLPIGITLFNDFDRRDRRGVVGTWFGRDHWGTGANGESKSLMAHLAFGPLGLERLGSYADVRNGRSQRALEKVGFVREGVLRAFHRHGDEPRDVVVYSMLRVEWEQSDHARVAVEITGSVPAAFAPA
jgi:[ribosomal protein S5]-alanine N-acetyltransferase